MKPSSQSYLVLHHKRLVLSWILSVHLQNKVCFSANHSIILLLLPTSPKQMLVICNPNGDVLYKYEGEPKLVQKHFKILNLIYRKSEARFPWEGLHSLSSGSPELSCRFHNLLQVLWQETAPGGFRSGQTRLRSIWKKVFCSRARDTPP